MLINFVWASEVNARWSEGHCSNTRWQWANSSKFESNNAGGQQWHPRWTGATKVSPDCVQEQQEPCSEEHGLCEGSNPGSSTCKSCVPAFELYLQLQIPVIFSVRRLYKIIPNYISIKCFLPFFDATNPAVLGGYSGSRLRDQAWCTVEGTSSPAWKTCTDPTELFLYF